MTSIKVNYSGDTCFERKRLKGDFNNSLNQKHHKNILLEKQPDMILCSPKRRNKTDHQKPSVCPFTVPYVVCMLVCNQPWTDTPGLGQCKK